jgi:arylsulfatase A-like enzyme
MRALLALALVSPLLAQDNVLLVVLDDIGVDRVRAYGEHPLVGSTPTLDQLAGEGVRFTRCWANPLCSPTRATILTGRYGFRTGIGHVIGNQYGTTGLSLEEWALPEVIRRATLDRYRTVCLGKWHLGGLGQGLVHAEDSGFHRFAGTLANLGEPDDPGAYYHWSKVVDGELATVHRYATTDTADDVLRTVEQLGDRPWFIWAAFHAAHVPYHRPPPDLADYPLSGDPQDSPAPHHKAMVQALDAELGRVLAGIDPKVLARTTVIVIADNGTQGPASEAPTNPTHGKGTLFEGGIRVPLIVWGAGVQQAGVCDALVNASDLFATTLELVGVDPAQVIPSDVPLDSVSLVPYLVNPGASSQRDFVYSEAFKPNNVPLAELVKLRRTLRDQRYKLVRNELDSIDRLYDLWLDPGEERDLLLLPELSDSQREAWRALDRRLRALIEQ